MKNWKNDDELLNLAFGELSDRDSQALEAKLLGNSSAQKELDLLRTLRSDMVAIRDDIPEMQFSKQRLRQAIAALDEQPKKAPKKWINWVLGPAALASVAALAFVITKGSGPKETVFVASNSARMNARVLPTAELELPAGLSAERVATKSKLIEPPVAPEAAGMDRDSIAQVRKSKPSKKRIRTKINSAILVASRGDEKSPMNTVTTQPKSGASNDAIPMTLAVATPGAITQPSTEAAPIILIDARTDSGVGAPTATEVSNPTNVAIGG
jgi:hypothetical protein